MRAWLLIAVVLLVGCDLTPINVPDYAAGISMACGVAAAMPDDSPDPDPSPDDEVCRSCGGTGWLGDGVIKEDCPDCDTPWKQTPIVTQSDAPPPPESPQPRQEVIDNSVSQESARPPQDAAEQGKARPLVNEDAMLDAIDETVKRTTGGGGMYYTQFRAAGEVAAETGRSLLLLIASRHPKDFEPPAGVVFCVVPSPPDGFRGWPTPSAILFREVTFAGHSDPIELDPTNLQSSLNQALETVP